MKTRMHYTLLVAIVAMAIGATFTGSVQAEELFSRQVGNVPVGQPPAPNPLIARYITWGGDMATFYANGGLVTKPGSIFNKQGLNVKLEPGDDFHQQVRDLLAGKIHLLRGTYRMVSMAAETCAQNPNTELVVFMQLTWSGGDHLVVKPGIKTIADLKGKKITLQAGGPHVGMLDDILKTGNLTWDDVEIVWAKDLIGTANCPEKIFRNNKDVDAACVITAPDGLIALTGGIQSVGSGGEGTYKGARCLVSTAELSKSIADVYACTKSFYESNKPLIQKFVAGYLKACEEVVALRMDYDSKGSKPFEQMLTLTQTIYGKDAFPSIEEDVYGLFVDCTFVGHPGNVAFFTDANNPNNFEAFKKNSLELMTGRGYAKKAAALNKADIDWAGNNFIGYLTKTAKPKGPRIKVEVAMSELEGFSLEGLDKNTLVSFDINFGADQSSFSTAEYGKDFDRVMQLSAKYGNAVIAVRGHACPFVTINTMRQIGIKQGQIKVTGTSGNRRHVLNGRPLDLNNTAQLVEMIQQSKFEVGSPTPMAMVEAALNLSKQRAEAVKKEIVAYAKTKGFPLDDSQILPVGVGISEPIIPWPSGKAELLNESGMNRRVEFRLVRVSIEVINADVDDFGL